MAEDGSPMAGTDGSSVPDGSTASDGSAASDGSSSPDGAPPGDAAPNADGGGSFSDGGVGPLACAAPAAYNTSAGGACGSYRWSVKVGTDSAARAVTLTPTEGTIQDLGRLPVPPNLSTSLPRTGPENTLYILRNITVIKTKRESDSDYHMPIMDPATGATMEAEIPFPPCGDTGSPFYCYTTHSRAALEKIITPSGSYQPVNRVATLIGPAFFDMLHGSASAAPNGIEIHPVLALCFGQDCDPTLD
jgi:hypothetical protein